MLRAKFTGQPEHVINFFFFVAEEVRELMAAMGYRTFNEMIGQMQMLDQRKVIEHWKAKGLDFSKLFTKPIAPDNVGLYRSEAQDHKIHDILDRTLIKESQAALDRGAPVRLATASATSTAPPAPCSRARSPNANGHTGLPDDTIQVSLKGNRGQSFGAFLAKGITFELEGEGNDYVGKGLSGGRIVIRPARPTPHRPGGIDHRRQHTCCTARSPARRISAASPASASPSAIPAPRWSWKAPAITAANT